jgi:hypothetical protein
VCEVKLVAFCIYLEVRIIPLDLVPGSQELQNKEFG